MAHLYPLPSNQEDQDDNALDNSEIDVALIENILTMITSGTTLKEFYGISDQMMEAVYAHAYDFYQSGKLDDAQIAFQFLFAHDVYNAKYAMGLAAIHQQKKNYAKAIELYAMAFELDPDNSLPLLYSGQCHLLLKNKEDARNCFTRFLETDAKDAVKRQARAYLNVLQPAKAEAQIHA